MGSATEVQALIQDTWPVKRTGSVQASLLAAYRYLRPRVHSREITHRRIETMWRGSLRRVDADEMDALRQAELEQARHEQKALRARLAALDARLAAFDEVSAG